MGRKNINIMQAYGRLYLVVSGMHPYGNVLALDIITVIHRQPLPCENLVVTGVIKACCSVCNAATKVGV